MRQERRYDTDFLGFEEKLPSNLSRDAHSQVSNDSDDEERERLERELAAKHGATTCAERGHDWDIAAAGGGMWAFVCTRSDCKLVDSSERGYTWDGQPA